MLHWMSDCNIHSKKKGLKSAGTDLTVEGTHNDGHLLARDSSLRPLGDS